MRLTNLRLALHRVLLQGDTNMNILQYIKSTQSERDLLHLNNRLTQFGLCPKEWEIKHESSNLYRIQNRSDHSFYFNGYTKNLKGNKIWQRIYLKNI